MLLDLVPSDTAINASNSTATAVTKKKIESFIVLLLIDFCMCIRFFLYITFCEFVWLHDSLGCSLPILLA